MIVGRGCRTRDKVDSGGRKGGQEISERERDHRIHIIGSKERMAECHGKISIRSMGNNFVLLQSTLKRTMKEVIEDFDEWVAF